MAQLAQSVFCITEHNLTQIFKGCPQEYVVLAEQTRQPPLPRGILEPPRNEYPLFEHLITFLYARWINPNISRTTLFGQTLSQVQKTNLGEALDYLLYSTFLPSNANIGKRVSLLSLCYHEKFGFRDDPVLLQRMWYIRAFLVLEDNPNGAGQGERWKWYDYRLTLVIYSWVRHNRKYHGCPKVQCPCRQIIDQYGLSIGTFKTLYMNLEKQCIRQLQFVRSNEPVWTPVEGSKSLSRAEEIKLYSKPDRKTWPSCFSDKAAEPDPPLSASTPTAAGPSAAPNSQVTPPVSSDSSLNPSTLPPPHPSLPVRPSPSPTSSRVSQTIDTPVATLSTAKASSGAQQGLLANMREASQPASSVSQPPPPSATSASANSSPSRQGRTLSNPFNLLVGMKLSGQVAPRAPRSRVSLDALTKPHMQPSTGMTPATSYSSNKDSNEVVTQPVMSLGSIVSPVIAPEGAAPRSRQSVIPSAPRSMREVKGVSTGPVPTGPRALAGTSKPPLSAPNSGKTAVYAGVPSAPRSMRVPPVKSAATSENMVNVVARSGEQSSGTAPNSQSTGSSAMDIDTSLSVPSAIAPEGYGNPSMAQMTHVLDLRTARRVPAVVPQVPAKRSRSDAKAEAILAETEVAAKSKTPGPSTDGTPSIPISQRQSTTDNPSSPSSPPTKRLKMLPDLDELTVAVNKAAEARKSSVKDGMAILAAVSKQKGATSTKATVQNKSKTTARARKGASSQSLKADGGINSEPDIEMLEAVQPTGTNGTQESSVQKKTSPQSIKASTSPPVSEKMVPKPSVSVSPATTAAPKRSTSGVPVAATSSNVPGGSAGKATTVAKDNGPPLAIKPGATRVSDSRPASPAFATQSAQAILQAVSNKRVVAGKLSSASRPLVRPKERISRPVRNSIESSTDGSTSEDEKGLCHYRSSSDDEYIYVPEPEPNYGYRVARKTVPTRYMRIPRSRAIAEGRRVRHVSSRLKKLASDRNWARRILEQEALEELATSVGANAGEQELASSESEGDDSLEKPASKDKAVNGSASSDSQPIAGRISSVNLPSATGNAETRASSQTSVETNPKRISTRREKSEVSTTKIKIKLKQSKSLKSNGDMERKDGGESSMAIDEESHSTNVPASERKQNAKTLNAKAGSNRSKKAANVPVSTVTEIMVALKNSPPFPTVLVLAMDPERRKQDASHEAHRLMSALVVVGVPMEWWMVGVTENGFIIRDEAAPLVVPLITEESIIQLNAIGIMMEVTPAEPVSDIDEEEVFASQETQSKPLSFPFKKSGSSALVIFDGQPERRLRSQPAEEKRLLNLVSVLVGKPLVDVTVEVNKLERTGLEEVVCLVFPKSKAPQLDEEQISVLGKAGLAIYQGETQLAGPVPVTQPSTSSQVPGTFDWREMRKEVMKMKLPWERNDNIDFQASAGPDSPTSMTHSSSSAGLAPSPADLHFRELLRPNLWSASGTFTRMATAGMRWGEFSGVDPDSSSDESDGDEAEQRLETVLHV